MVRTVDHSLFCVLLASLLLLFLCFVFFCVLGCGVVGLWVEVDIYMSDLLLFHSFLLWFWLICGRYG
jgi:hypothetical protein